MVDVDVNDYSILMVIYRQRNKMDKKTYLRCLDNLSEDAKRIGECLMHDNEYFVKMYSKEKSIFRCIKEIAGQNETK